MMGSDFLDYNINRMAQVIFNLEVHENKGLFGNVILVTLFKYCENMYR